MSWSRRQILGLGGLSTLAGLAGCASVSLTGTLGFRLRNYTSAAYDATVEIRLAGQTTFERTFQLPSASSADPYVYTETDAVSNIPSGMSYTVSLFLDGTEVRTHEATMDCTDRDSQRMDEEIDINIGFGGDETVEIADTQC
ncbi:hypothetical protein M0R89_19900 (plasmid) [Halorussus limi]|uniref:Lipoprotein n=1 Tax=Halorussus limi TaxID=2938695 RepID=A0A8U0HZS4_9EURY|nr:hypothetical protein [Halorussus limi]UPV76427.1 hypothetical protein M0R89_19900 [Halorussus limi]